MMSEEKIQEQEIYRICEESRDVELHQRFKGTVTIRNERGGKLCEEIPCTCIGKLGNSKRIFITDDRCTYYIARSGWGEKDGYLVAVDLKIRFETDEPKTIDELRDFVNNPPEAHGWAGHMSRGHKISTTKSFIELLEKISYTNEE